MCSYAHVFFLLDNHCELVLTFRLLVRQVSQSLTKDKQTKH